MTIGAPAACAEPAPEPHELTATDLSAFLDGQLPTALDSADIAGAVVIAVKDNQVLVAKGYGYADTQSHKPVDPSDTLFHLASISKLFTWTAVMQLVEQHRLDLDRDVNDYLDFHIPDAFDTPITLRHLMTHTAGFEESYWNMLRNDARELTSLREALRSHVPARIFPPGEVPAYSNYGAALAGYIVERVAAQPFEQYIDDHVFKPLGMHSSSFAHVLPTPLRERESKGYIVASQPPFMTMFAQTSPAGGAISSAADMALFMLAHLGNGAVGDARILNADTAAYMHTTAFNVAADRHFSGMTLGFYEDNRNGHRVLAHGGDLPAFRSDLHLIPDAGVGLFVSMNSSGTGDANYVLRLQLYRAFMDRYFPASTVRSTNDGPRQSVSRPDLSGYYTWSRHVASNFLSLATMFGQAQLSPNEHGGFSVDQITGVASTPLEWRADGEDSWIDAHGSSRITVVRNSDRTLRYLAVDDSFPAAVLQPVPWYLSKSWNVPLYVGSLAALLVTVVAWPIAFLVRYRQERSARVETHFFLGYLASCLHAAVLCVWFWLISDIGGHIYLFNDHLNWLIKVMQAAAGIAAVITALVLWRTMRVWNAPTHGTPTKIGYTLGAFACCGAVWLTITFRLLPLGNL